MGEGDTSRGRDHRLSAFKEGGSCALSFKMCRFGGRAEFLRTVEEMKLNFTTKV